MPEYIEREKAIKYLDKQMEETKSAVPKESFTAQIYDMAKRHAIEHLTWMPAADVAEVVNGYNKTAMNPVDEFWCSVCGFCCADYTETKYDEDGDYTYSCECKFDYCPKCGAKMEAIK